MSLSDMLALDTFPEPSFSDFEEEEVLFVSGEDALLHQILGESFTHVAQLVAQFEGVPGLQNSFIKKSKKG